MDPHEEELRQAKIDIVWLLSDDRQAIRESLRLVEIARRMKCLLGRLEAAERTARALAHLAGMKYVGKEESTT